jgi:outer membrane protein OmpA-like peptidoglycan-associated protein
MAEQAIPDNGVLRFFTDAWPLVALGVVAALIIRACVPTPPSTPATETTSRAEASTAGKTGNSGVIAALNALTSDSGVGDAVQALNLISIGFGAGSSTLPETADAVLSKAAAVISALPATERFEISVHADGALSPLADLELSRRRSQAVVDFLVNQGVPSRRLQPRAIGDQDPVAGEPGQESSFQNQRVQFTLLP